MAGGSAAKAVRHRATERGRSTSPSPHDALAISPTRRASKMPRLNSPAERLSSSPQRFDIEGGGRISRARDAEAVREKRSSQTSPDRTTGETPPRDAKHAARRPLPDDDDAGADEDRNAGSDSDACTNYGDRVGGEEARRPEEKEKSPPRAPSSGDRRATPPRPTTSGWTASMDASPGPPCDLPIEYWTRSEACTERKRAHVEAIDREGGYWGMEDHIERTVFAAADADVVLEPNMFPYDVPPGISHWTLWSREPMSEREIVRWTKAHLAEAKPSVTSWNYDLNDNNSVDVPHYHVFLYEEERATAEEERENLERECREPGETEKRADGRARVGEATDSRPPEDRASTRTPPLLEEGELCELARERPRKKARTDA